MQGFVLVSGAVLLRFCAEGARVNVSGHGFEHVMRDDDPSMALQGTTVQGCTCKSNSKCGASVNDGFQCDWCWVEGKCGEKQKIDAFGLLGRWDYCSHPEMPTYEAQSASDKMGQLWNKITAPDVVGQSSDTASLLGVLFTLVGSSMRTAFDTHWDVIPEGRKKVIHSQGVHCEFELDVAAGSPYTGLFAPGKALGIIRIGSASSLDKTGKAPFPGLSFKFLRSGVHSGNFVALRATGPKGGGYAFFDQEFSKIVSPPKELQALMKFDSASQCQSMVGLSDLCSYAQDGSPAEHAQFPYDIRFERSTDDILLPDQIMSDAEMLGHLSAIKAGTRLFNVYTRASPTAEKAVLGTLSTTSQCVKSVFGDEHLFFRHQRMEEDFVKQSETRAAGTPTWVDEVAAAGVPGCMEPVAAPSSQWQCPGVH